MKGISKYWNKISLPALLPVLIFILVMSCEEPAPFPDKPFITFKDLEFVENTENGIADTLILSFDFEDGQGDLGVNPDDQLFPLHDYFVVTDENALPISISETNLPERQFLYVPPLWHNPIYIEDPEEYRLPSQTFFFFGNFYGFEDNFTELPEFNCDDYAIVYIDEGRLRFFDINTEGEFDADVFSIDTVLVHRNPGRYNFYIEFFRKTASGYDPLELSAPDASGCVIPFHGRFPELDVENIGSSLEGTIKYSMPSFGFRVRIRTDLFKIRFYILDHKFEQSNVVETGDFTLDDLIRQ